MDKTMSGKTCQAWVAKTPHFHKDIYFEDEQLEGQENHSLNFVDQTNQLFEKCFR